MIKKLFVFLTAIVMALTVAVAPQTALAEHEDYTCAEWGTCEDHSGIVNTLSNLLVTFDNNPSYGCYYYEDYWGYGYYECW